MLSSNSPYLLVAILVIAGLAFFGIGTAIVRSARDDRSPEWPSLVDETTPDVDQRVEMVERLALVGSDWSCDVLRRAKREERNPKVLAAIDRALKR